MIEVMCSHCKRRSSSIDVGAACAMPQPNGCICFGVFQSLGEALEADGYRHYRRGEFDVRDEPQGAPTVLLSRGEGHNASRMRVGVESLPDLIAVLTDAHAAILARPFKK